jgi:hypothetical protein
MKRRVGSLADLFTRLYDAYGDLITFYQKQAEDYQRRLLDCEKEMGHLREIQQDIQILIEHERQDG